MNDIIYDDPVWEYVLVTALQKYIPAVRKWWAGYDSIIVRGTGVFDIKFDDDTEVPPGLQMRVTSTPVRSPIKNVQAFPFVPTAYFQIANVPGGVCKMIERVCKDNKMTLEEFVIVEKHNLPSTYQKGQFIAFVPKDVMSGVEKLGKYVYMTVQELSSIANGNLPQSVQQKCMRYSLADN